MRKGFIKVDSSRSSFIIVVSQSRNFKQVITHIMDSRQKQTHVSSLACSPNKHSLGHPAWRMVVPTSIDLIMTIPTDKPSCQHRHPLTDTFHVILGCINWTVNAVTSSKWIHGCLQMNYLSDATRQANSCACHLGFSVGVDYEDDTEKCLFSSLVHTILCFCTQACIAKPENMRLATRMDSEMGEGTAQK